MTHNGTVSTDSEEMGTTNAPSIIEFPEVQITLKLKYLSSSAGVAEQSAFTLKLPRHISTAAVLP
jgi:hypothetical protein